MKSALMTFFICAAVVIFALVGFEYLSDREAVKRAEDMCGSNGVYDLDTRGWGYWITCNTTSDLEGVSYLLLPSEDGAVTAEASELENASINIGVSPAQD